MRLGHRYLLSLSCVALVGCAARVRPDAAIPSIQPFTEPDWSNQAGSTTITGQGFLRTMIGEVRTCAGSRVLLVPAIPYTESLFALRKAGLANLIEPRLAQFARVDVCDAQGNFKFEGLPAGRWFVETNVSWFVPVKNGTEKQGGSLVGLVETREGQTRFMLTDNHAIRSGCLGTFDKKGRCVVGRRRAHIIEPLFDGPIAEPVSTPPAEAK